MNNTPFHEMCYAKYRYCNNGIAKNDLQSYNWDAGGEPPGKKPMSCKYFINHGSGVMVVLSASFWPISAGKMEVEALEMTGPLLQLAL